MAAVLGYKGKVTWETIQNPYVPVGLSQQMQTQSVYSQEMLAAVMQINRMVGGAGGNASGQSDE